MGWFILLVAASAIYTLCAGDEGNHIADETNNGPKMEQQAGCLPVILWGFLFYCLWRAFT